MSDIAKKTLPPGSWPGSKGVRGTATATDANSEAGGANASAAPRSVVSGAGDQHNRCDRESEVADNIHAIPEEHEGDSHYTHQTQSQPGGLQEEGQQPAAGVGAGDASVHESQADLKRVEPEALHVAGPEDGDGEHEQQQQQQEEEEEEEDEDDDDGGGDDDEGYGSRSTLTERAKQAFDAAAEGQQTDEAHDRFLSLAQDNAGAAPSASGATGEHQQKEQLGEDAGGQGEQVENALGELKEGAQQGELKESEIPSQVADQSKLPTEMGEGEGEGQDVPEVVGEGSQKPPTEGLAEGVEGVAGAEHVDESQLGSKAPSKVPTAVGVGEGENENTERGAAPSELRSHIPEGEVGPDGSASQIGSRIPNESQFQLQGAPSVLAKLPTEMREQLAQGIVPSALRSQLGTTAAGDLAEQVHDLQQNVAQPQLQGEGAGDDQGTQADDAAEPDQHPLDFTILKNGRVNKGGNVVDPNGRVVGRVVEGVLAYLIGRKVDEAGQIWGDDGKVLGRAEPVAESERDEMLKEPAPFESFPDAVVDAEGMVVSNGEYVGKVVAGDLKVLRGKSVDADGDILDKGGNVIGKAERWEPEPEDEPEPEPEVDRSILAGKRVNKAGNVVDSSGTIYGRVVEGDAKSMIGRMCDKYGNVLSESGDVIGRAELVTEGEREGLKEGPFAELSGCTVAKDGKVVTPSGDVVGRLVSGDPKVLFGRAVDEDGDVVDRNGNVLGKAERWEEPEVEKKKNPLSGRRVNREGNVVDADGNLVGKLTTGSLSVCAGKEIDDDGDVVDGKGTVIGHVSLLDEIPEEPKEEVEEETPEEKAKREQAATDKKLAVQMTVCIAQCLDKIRPICKMITDKIDHAERQPEDERDEEQLVREVRPLIEEGGRILQEAKGIIKGLDPDGRISANAKHKTAAREATPEEYQLADVLKDLTGEVTECIENAKRKIEDMPHAKKELNPLWGLLNEPLFQILAAVGLLLNGVLSLVGRLLSGLGLGGLLDGLLGTLGLNRVLEGLGLGAATKALTGGDKKKKGGGGGLLGGLLGGGK